MENGDQILPFIRCFYGRPSTYLWEDELGETQHIPQGEGGARTLSCRCCSPSDNIQHWRQLRVDCVIRRNSSHIWTMWFSCAGQIALPRLKLSSEKSSDVMRMLMSIRARPKSGTGEESPQMALRSSPRWPSW